MPAATKQVSVVAAYAKALLDLANERQQAEAIAEELRGLKELLQANPTFGLFLRDPGISEDERHRVLDRVLKGRVSSLMMNTLGVLNHKGRLALITAIADQYQAMLDEQQGKIEVKATVAQELDPELLEEVKQRVSDALKKKAAVHQLVDDSIIGGMILQVNDRLIDASVRTQLQLMKQHMLAAAPK